MTTKSADPHRQALDAFVEMVRSFNGYDDFEPGLVWYFLRSSGLLWHMTGMNIDKWIGDYIAIHKAFKLRELSQYEVDMANINFERLFGWKPSIIRRGPAKGTG
jgi:hypothetical protein